MNIYGAWTMKGERPVCTAIAVDPFGQAPAPEGLVPMNRDAYEHNWRDAKRACSIADDRGSWRSCFDDDIDEALRRSA